MVGRRICEILILFVSAKKWVGRARKPDDQIGVALLAVDEENLTLTLKQIRETFDTKRILPGGRVVRAVTASHFENIQHICLPTPFPLATVLVCT